VPSESLPASESLERDCSRLVRKAQVELRLPSVSAVVFRGADTVWEEAIGLADADGANPVTPDHQ
jgi:Beta-lactamase